MITKSLYKRLYGIINEARVQRTIDNKLWLSVASTISRNRSTEAEFIKPNKNETKDQLMQRYVAALIILRKTCPQTEQDIEDLKTYKFVGKRIIDLGGTFKEIYNLYLKNGGTPITTNLQDAEQQLQAQPTQQVQKSPVSNNADKEQQETVEEIVEDLPEGIKSYDSIYKHVINTYTDMLDVANNISAILETTNFEINKSFYKIKKGKQMIYFNKIYTDDNILLYRRGLRNIFMTQTVFSITSFKQYTTQPLVLEFREKDIQTPEINRLYNYGEDIELSGIYVTKDEFTSMLQAALAKLLFVMQNEYITNPIEPKNVNKEAIQPLGNYGPIPSFQSFTDKVKKQLISKIKNKYSCNKKLIPFIIMLLKYKNGNIDIKTNDVVYKNVGYQTPSPLYTTSLGGRPLTIDCIFVDMQHNTLHFFFKYYKLNKGNEVPTWSLENTDCLYHDWSAGVKVNISNKDKYNLLLEFTAYICYFSNNTNI